MRDSIACGPIIFCFVPVAFVQEEMCCGNSFFQKEAGRENIFQKDKQAVFKNYVHQHIGYTALSENNEQEHLTFHV